MTAHEDAASALLDELLAMPDGNATLMKYQLGIRDERYDRDLVDAIGQQHFSPRNWPLEQVAAFSHVYSGLMGGVIARTIIGCDGEPHADRRRDTNAAILGNLPAPFVAHLDMDQRNADDDGLLEWTEPIIVEKSTGAAFMDPYGATYPLQTFITVQPGSVPLEVGSSKASVTMMHIGLFRGVARWPYGHKQIHLFLNTHWFSHQPDLSPVRPPVRAA